MYSNIFKKINFGFNRVKTGKAAVLMYHRIISREFDPWQLTVSPENFEDQISMLSEKFNVITLDGFERSLYDKHFDKDSVLVTFDDAYSDTYFNAVPILEKYNTPTTFFVPSMILDEAALYWWDSLEDIILHTEILPLKLELQVGEEELEIKLDQGMLNVTQRELHKTWIYTENPPTERCSLFLFLWEKLLPLPGDEIAAILEKLKQWAGYQKSLDNASLPMTIEQLNAVKSGQLFNIALHTNSHTDLSSHDKRVQIKEISDSKKKMEKFIGKPIRSVAYPYGKYNSTTLDIMSKLNLIGFTTIQETVTHLSNPLKLGRMQVLNVSASVLEMQLRSELD